MPRIMTMNGDHESVATAPLDLRTTHRERGSAGSTTPDYKGRASDARVTGGSPAPPACTGTDSLEIHAACSEASAARKRPLDKSSLKLPFRKRPFHAVPEIQRQSPAPPHSEDRSSPATSAEDAVRESVSRRLENPPDVSRVGVAAVAPRRAEGPGQSLDGYTVCYLPPYNYGHYMYCYAREPNHTLVHQTENLLNGIALAAHQDEDGDTALHIAVVQGELAFVCKLIDLLRCAGRSLDIYNNLLQTPLHLAVITRQPNIVDRLLRAGADPTALDRNGQTAFHLCCEYNQPECLSVVLTRSSPPHLEIRNYQGFSPLHLAVLRDHKDLARMLLDAGADINAMDIKSGQSPLMLAVESNNADMVHFLIEKACDVNSQSYSGNTALHSACGRGQVDTVRMLLKSGADSSLKNYHNDTPVMVAKNKKIADVLRGRGSKPIRNQDQNCVPVSPHGSTFMENGSPSSNHSHGCSPSTTPHPSHHSTSQSPKIQSMLAFPYF